MHYVGQGDVRVRLVHEVVEHDERLHDGGLDVVELQPFLALVQKQKSIQFIDHLEQFTFDLT